MMNLVDGWEVASSPPGKYAGPADLAGLDWQPARVPGTAAAAVGADGRDFDAEDWWFRCHFTVPSGWLDDELALEFGGIATVSEVFLGGERVLESSSMWAVHVVDVTGRVHTHNELAIVCHALKPLLAVRRRPSARWRTRVVNESNLRWYRTMMFGRSPGFAPGPAAVGPWRPVRLARRGGVGIESVSVRTRLDGRDGVVLVSGSPTGSAERAEVVLDGKTELLRATADGRLEAELRIPGVERWWPHTHGQPVLHEVALKTDGQRLTTRKVGFRSLSWPEDLVEDGLDLHVNGVPIFVRGAVWTPADLISLAPTATELRALLERVRDAGMNMLRVVGTGAYESPAFHDLCDELGILVWQDLMFANLDYPTEDRGFRAEVEREARQVLAQLAGRPSLTVICGNSEVEQQPAMMGLDPALGRGELWDEVIPRIVAESNADCAYVRSTPCGGDLPFHADRGVTHYFGVSGYFRPPDDARRAEVRFAAECLAFANVPDEVEVPVHHPRWKFGVQRDAGTGWDLGAGWDFDDVRDYYLGLLFGVDPVQLRRSEHARYLELSRAASGEVMAEVMGEWRRAASPCRGALVLWLKDMLPGAGLGVLDHRGLPKVAYHHLRRALSPIAVWTTDEGVGGIAVHVVNDRPEPLQARLRVALYRDLEARIDEKQEQLELPSHGAAQRSVEGLLSRFVDAAWAYRFGPPAQDAIVVSLESLSEPSELFSQAIRFPAGRPTAREPAARMRIEASGRPDGGGAVALSICSQRLAYGVRVHTPGFLPDDDAFSIEPGRERVVRLRPAGVGSQFAGGSLTALNLDGPVKIGADTA
jgi:beta-mannosidase